MFVAIDQVIIADAVPAARVCDLLSVSRVGVYSWRKGQRSLRELIPLINDIFWHHRRRHCARRIAEELKRREVLCGVGRVARLLKSQGLRAIQPRSFKPKTTFSRHRLGFNDNLLVNHNSRSAINEIWVGGIT